LITKAFIRVKKSATAEAVAEVAVRIPDQADRQHPRGRTAGRQLIGGRPVDGTAISAE
jgi:hypothetical protein